MVNMVDVSLLYQALDARRASLGVSWRTVAADLDVGSPLFTRLQHGNMIDLVNYVKCCQWLGIPLATDLDTELALLLARHHVASDDLEAVLSIVRAYLRNRGDTSHDS